MPRFNIKLIMQCLLAAVIVLFMLSLPGYMRTKENHEVVLKKYAAILASMQANMTREGKEIFDRCFLSP